MRNSKAVTPALTIGIDLGDETSHACVLDSRGGEVVERFSLPSTDVAFSERFFRRRRSRVVVEAGTHSPWASRLLGAAGHEVIVANPRKVRLISGSNTKSDREDAETLARLGRSDVRLLHPIEHRDAAVRTRTRLINHVRGAVKSFGCRVPSSSAPAFEAVAAESVPKALRPALRPILRMIRELTKTIRGYDKKVEALCEKEHPETARMRQVGGVGHLTSLAFKLVVRDPKRFPKTRDVAAYLGLLPRREQSGELDPQLHITKAGDRYVRRLLVSAAQYILGPFGPDCTLRRIGDRLAAVGGRAAKKRAVVAVARRLSVLMLHLWKADDRYDPLRDAPPLAAAPTETPAPAAAST